MPPIAMRVVFLTTEDALGKVVRVLCGAKVGQIENIIPIEEVRAKTKRKTKTKSLSAKRPAKKNKTPLIERVFAVVRGGGDSGISGVEVRDLLHDVKRIAINPCLRALMQQNRIKILRMDGKSGIYAVAT